MSDRADRSGSESRLQRAVRHWRATIQEEGLRRAVEDERGHVRWRLAGSPEVVAPMAQVPDFDEWREVHESVAALNPHAPTPFAVICPVHNTPPALLEQCVASVRAGFARGIR